MSVAPVRSDFAAVAGSRRRSDAGYSRRPAAELRWPMILRGDQQLTEAVGCCRRLAHLSSKQSVQHRRNTEGSEHRHMQVIQLSEHAVSSAAPCSRRRTQ